MGALLTDKVIDELFKEFSEISVDKMMVPCLLFHPTQPLTCTWLNASTAQTQLLDRIS